MNVPTISNRYLLFDPAANNNTLTSKLAIAILLIFSLVPNVWAQQANEYYNKGVDLMNQGRYEEAIAALDISIDIEPAGDAYYAKGIALDSLGRSEEAIAAFDQALVF